MLYLIKGKEPLLQSRGIAVAKKSGLEKDPNAEIVEISAKGYSAGALQAALSPTLFSSSAIVLVPNAESFDNDAFVTNVLTILESFETGTNTEGTLILVHSGALKGAKFVKAIEKAANPREVKVIQAAELKKPSEKAAFVAAEFRKNHKAIANDASEALVQYAGDDLGILAGFCAQLANDAPEEMSSITKAYIDTFFRGLQQVDVYEIINAAVAGDAPTALKLFRHAVQYGESPNSIIPRASAKIRQIIKAGAASSRGLSAAQIGMSPWMMQNAQREMRNFTTGRFVNSILALSEADIAAKGGSPDKGMYAFEKALLAIAGK